MKEITIMIFLKEKKSLILISKQNKKTPFFLLLINVHLAKFLLNVTAFLNYFNGYLN